MDNHDHSHNQDKKIKKHNVLLKVEDFKKLEESARKSEEYYDRLIRFQADFDNYKKRAEKERSDFIKFANEGIILEIVKILDDFERAVEAGKAKHDFDILYKGVEMIYKDLKGFLKENGLNEIDAVGKPFNPHEHEAMMQEEKSDVPENQVIEELQKGYVLNGRVIRPSKVKIAKNSKSE